MLLNWAEHATPNVFSAAARAYTRLKLADHHRPIHSLVISNVPGPDFPLYLAGSELVAGFPLGPVMDGAGLNITVMSYRGVLNWGLMACAETVPRAGRTGALHPRRARRAARGCRASGPPYPVGVAPGRPRPRRDRSDRAPSAPRSRRAEARLSSVDGQHRDRAGDQCLRAGTRSGSGSWAAA